MKLSLSQFEAVAFDLEGTLADTIPTHHATRSVAFERHGFGHITKEQHALGPTYGSSHFDIIGGVLYAAGEIDSRVPFSQNQTVLDVVATKSALFAEAAAKGFEAMPGAVRFVSKLAPRFLGNLAIVTSSEEVFANAFLERYDLKRHFADRLVIGHETVINEGLEVKPSGDPYTLAMRRLGTTRLLVFEDTVPGVVSAKKAGATVIALAFDKHNANLFRNGQLEYPPDLLVTDYEEAAIALGVAA